MKRIFFLLLSFIYLHLLSAQSVSEQEFESGTFNTCGISIPYRCTHLNADKEDSRPVLFIFLHGKSACGTDNKSQLTKDSLIHAVDYLMGHNINAYVLAPQCEEKHQWGSIAEEVKEFIETFTNDHAVPEEKVFISGESMGGGGVWGLLNNYPSLIHRAVAIACSASGCLNYNNLCKTPVYSVLGELDMIGQPKKVLPVIKKINEKGGEAKIKILKDHDHIPACEDGLSEDVLDWLFEVYEKI